MVAGHLQEKKGLFYIVLNFVDSDGKRKRKWIATGLPVKGNKRKAEAMLVAERQKYQPAEYQRTADANMLFADYMLYWLRQIKSSVDITTYAGYKTNVEKRIVPFFRGRKVTLGGLRAGDIQDFYTYCATELEISNNTIIKYHANISKALNDAVRLEKIPMTPLKRGMRPKQVEHIGKFYTLSEVEHLLSCVKGDGAEFPVLMAAFYGLRRSEIMGLKWDSIDFDANTITIAHVVVEVSIDGKDTIVAKDRPKNKKSYRTLPLVPEYRRLLLQMKKHQEEYRKLCGNCYHGSGYIYVNDLGEPIRPNYVSQHFKLVLKNNNLREITFHELRHPYVKHTTKIFSLRLMDFQAQAYPDARRKTRGACQLLRGGQSRSPVRPLCNRKRFSCLPPQAKMSWILYAISMRLSGYTSTRSISSSASSVVSASASKIALDASFRLSCRACSSCFCFACANTAA